MERKNGSRQAFHKNCGGRLPRNSQRPGVKDEPHRKTRKKHQLSTKRVNPDKPLRNEVFSKEKDRREKGH